MVEINGAFNRNSRRIFPVGFLLFLSRLKTEKTLKGKCDCFSRMLQMNQSKV